MDEGESLLQTPPTPSSAAEVKQPGDDDDPLDQLPQHLLEAFQR